MSAICEFVFAGTAVEKQTQTFLYINTREIERHLSTLLSLIEHSNRIKSKGATQILMISKKLVKRVLCSNGMLVTLVMTELKTKRESNIF